MASTIECPICFGEINQAATGITTLSCSHSFHFNCLTKWFYAQPGEEQTCPCCRHEAGELERLPMQDEVPEDSDDEEADEEDEWLDEEELDEGGLRSTVQHRQMILGGLAAEPIPDGPPVPVAEMINYRLTATWTQVSHDRWVRTVTVPQEDERTVTMAPISQPDEDAVLKHLATTAIQDNAASRIAIAWRSHR